MLQTGPVRYRLRSGLAGIAAVIHRLYGDFPLPSSTRFADFHPCLRRVPDALLRPRANLLLEGEGQFKPFPVRCAAAHLEWGLNRCIFRLMHDRLLIHAAVLERGGRAVVLVGATGSGKSTLCAGLALRGWRLLSDEMAMLDPTTGMLAALARPVILKNQAIGVIRDLEPVACFGPTVPGTPKGTIAHMRPPAESVARAGESAPPGWFVLVRFQPGAAFALERLGPGRGLMAVAACAFNYGVLGRVGFEALATAVDVCPCYELTYGDLGEALARFAKADWEKG